MNEEDLETLSLLLIVCDGVEVPTEEEENETIEKQEPCLSLLS